MMIGLTGGIGCGKSTVLEIFSSLGWKPLDADAICHRLYENPGPELIESLSSRWGGAVFDSGGKISRAKIASIVFSDRKELDWLNSVIHPAVYSQALNEARRLGRLVMFDVPLLFESGRRGIFKKVICVWSGRELCVKRLRKRGFTEEQVGERAKMQLPSEEKLSLADYGIINAGSLGYLREQCMILDRILKQKI